MKNKNLFLSFLTSLLSLVLIVPMFLNIFGYKWTLGDNEVANGLAGMFGDYTCPLMDNIKTINTLWSVVFNVCMIIGLVLAVAYLAVFILELLNVKKVNFKKAKQIIGLGFTIVFVVALVGLVLFIRTNHYKGEYLNYQLNIIPQVGAYITLAVLFISAVMAFISAGYSNKAVKKGKKRK